MSEYNQCVYTHDISDEGKDIEIFEQMDEEEWSCQHPAAEDAKYCLFHQPIEEKDDKSVVKRFLEVVNTGYQDIQIPLQERVRFIGAKFGDFSLPLFSTLATSSEFNSTADGIQIDLRSIQVHGTLHWAEAKVRHDVIFDGLSVDGKVDFSETIVNGRTSLKSGSFNSDVDLDNITTEEAITFHNSNFNRDISMSECDISGYVDFSDTTFSSASDDGQFTKQTDINCRNGNIGSDLVFKYANFVQNIKFKRANINGDVNLRKTKFENQSTPVFTEASISGNLRCDWSSSSKPTGVVLNSTKIDGSIINVNNFDGDFTLNQGYVGGDITVKTYASDDDIDGSFLCNECRIKGAVNLDEINIAGDLQFNSSELKNGIECGESKVVGDIDLQNAEVGGTVSFEDAKSEGDVDISEASVADAINFRSATLTERLVADCVVVSGETILSDADVEGRLTLNKAQLKSGIEARRTTVFGEVSATNMEVSGDVVFYKSRLKDTLRLCGINVSGSIQFSHGYLDNKLILRDATIHGDSQFSKAMLNGESVFTNSDFDGDLDLIDTTFENAPVFDSTRVSGTLWLAFSISGEEQPLVDFKNASIETIQSMKIALNLPCRFDQASLGQINVPDQTASSHLRSWSLKGMDFSIFDFRSNQSILTSVGYEIDELDNEARTALAGHIAEEMAMEDAQAIVHALVGVPSVRKDIISGHVDTESIKSVLTAMTNTVFTDENLISKVEEGRASKTEITAAETIQNGFFDDSWTFTETTAEALYTLSVSVSDEQRKIDPNSNFSNIIRQTASKIDKEAKEIQTFTEKIQDEISEIEDNIAPHIDKLIEIADSEEFLEDIHSELASSDIESDVPNIQRWGKFMQAINDMFNDNRNIEIPSDQYAEVGGRAKEAQKSIISGCKKIKKLADDYDITPSHKTLTHTNIGFIYFTAIEMGSNELTSEYFDPERLAGALEWLTEEKRVRNRLQESSNTAGSFLDGTLSDNLTEQYSDHVYQRLGDDTSEWEATYQEAKTAATQAGMNEMAAEFFLREKRFKRRRHAQRVQKKSSISTRAGAAMDWVSNLAMDVTTGYGERPRNVVASSLATVGLFAGIYWGLDALESDASVLEYILFSFQGFIQFILGASPRGDVPVRLATAIEGFVGAFLIALFVFTLTRSLNR